jgi:erythromycin esterase-like protein
MTETREDAAAQAQPDAPVSHYFYARMAEQFDAVVHCDETRAVEPLAQNQATFSGTTR